MKAVLIGLSKLISAMITPQMKKQVFMLALLIAPISISTAFAGSCGGEITRTQMRKKKPSNT